ncbi:helix-turn-helix transcriptional regulator [Enterococcus sp. DIV0660C]|uniref:helix-turn-helix domain-containing protein n=1 Tax=Enterococcus sp. DIV0660C TaxID=2230880 RepID=UPI001A8E0F11|nr:helix-turn-helix transcriptional regulator [Enterococcus sp. DIV0660C]
MSQSDLAKDICSQATISAIESGKYMPNVKILVELCNKLDLNTDMLILHDYYKISSIEKFSEECERLCKNHEYQKLETFLNSTEVLNSVETEWELQAYYYYLACANFHLDSDLTGSYRNFKLSLAEKENNTLARLSFACLGLISSLKKQKKQTFEYFLNAFKNIESIPYEPNLNILFYLEAYSYLNLGMLETAFLVLESAIDFISNNDSHFMLGNIYFLATKVAERAEQLNIVRDNEQKSSIFEELFNEKIYKNI